MKKESLERGVSIALGTFDGLHLGHRKVLQTLGNDGCVLLFREHPQKVLSGKDPGELITPEKEKQLLSVWGIEPLWLDFPEIASFSAERFFNEILMDRFGASSLVCGFNYHFGAGAKGDVSLLGSLCEKKGLRLTVCEPVLYDGLPISSTRIRESLKNGEIRKANAMLGRYFSYDFTVVHGDARGRTLGFPTINQYFSDDFTVPQYGVYASFAIVGGKKYPSVTNVGIRPTVGSVRESSETHIIGYDGDLYGRSVEVCLIEKMRGEIKFSSVAALGEQIARDKESALKITDAEAVK